jgi:hypothetical protein
MAEGDKERAAEEAEDARLEARFQAEQELHEQRLAASRSAITTSEASRRNQQAQTAPPCPSVPPPSSSVLKPLTSAGAAITPSGQAILPPPKPPTTATLADAPQSQAPKTDAQHQKEKMDAVRTRVTAQIHAALPAIAAALSSKAEEKKKASGKSGG